MERTFVREILLSTLAETDTKKILPLNVAYTFIWGERMSSTQDADYRTNPLNFEHYPQFLQKVCQTWFNITVILSFSTEYLLSLQTFYKTFSILFIFSLLHVNTKIENKLHEILTLHSRKKKERKISNKQVAHGSLATKKHWENLDFS